MEHQIADSRPADRVPADAGVDLSLARQRLGNDEELLRELARICVEDLPGLLETALTGVDPDAVEEAARCTHSLKGLAANFSTATAEAAQAAESAIRRGDLACIPGALAILQSFTERLIAELKRSVLQESRDGR